MSQTNKMSDADKEAESRYQWLKKLRDDNQAQINSGKPTYVGSDKALLWAKYWEDHECVKTSPGDKRYSGQPLNVVVRITAKGIDHVEKIEHERAMAKNNTADHEKPKSEPNPKKKLGFDTGQ